MPKLATRLEKDKRFSRTGIDQKRNSNHRSHSPDHISDGVGRSSDGDILGSGFKKGSIYKHGNHRVIQIEGKGNRMAYENLNSGSHTSHHEHKFRATGGSQGGSRVTIYQ